MAIDEHESHDSLASAIAILRPGERIHAASVPWAVYLHLSEIRDERRRRLKITFDRGRLELLMPATRPKQLDFRLGLIVMALVEESELDLINAGRTTLQNVAEEQALEADQSFYIANADAVIGVSDIDLSIHPPPDLAVEFDPLLSSVPREAIYARIGVPELWRYDGNEFEFLLLQPSGDFQTAERSLALPQLRPQDIERLLEATHAMDDVAFVNHCRSWARRLSSRTPE